MSKAVMNKSVTANVPALRFGEFEGEWETSTFEELDAHISDGIHSTPIYDDNGEYYFINGNNLVGGSIAVDEKTKKVSKYEFEKYKKPISEKTILLSINGTIGNLAFYHNEKVVLGKSACFINLNVTKTDKNFIFNILRTSKIQQFFCSELTGSTIKNLSLKTIKNTAISIPCLDEQQKIANFLSAVDSKLNTLEKTHAALNRYKRGLMQQLFSQARRFKDDNGQDFPDWEEKSVGDIVDNYGGTALENLVSKTGEYKFISIGNYSVDGYFIDNQQRINPIEKAANKILYKDNLVMVLNDKTATGDLIGSTILIDDGKYIYNQRSERLVCKEGLFPKFAWFVFNSTEFRKKIVSISQGGTQIYVNFPAVRKLNLSIPSIKEQQKIAQTLSTLDNKITAAATQITQLKTFKKGLLQQMFV
jgi:type I restriction enzyme, S subunit